MTDLSHLLTLIQSSTGQLEDETLGRVICALKGLPFEKIQTMGDEMCIRTNGNNYPMPIFVRSRAPDNSIDASMKLAAAIVGVWTALGILIAATAEARTIEEIPCKILARLIKSKQDTIAISCLMKEGDSRS
jgi:hypothetical protein